MSRSMALAAGGAILIMFAMFLRSSPHDDLQSHRDEAIVIPSGRGDTGSQPPVIAPLQPGEVDDVESAEVRAASIAPQSALEGPSSYVDAVSDRNVGLAPSAVIVTTPEIADLQKPGAELFPISGSVKAACERTPDDCAGEYRLLSRMAEEPRDDAWASAVEKTLREWVQDEQNRYEIRILECRRSVCVVEVASDMGRYAGPEYQQQKANGISDEAAVFGYERSSDGTIVTITLRLFERR